ncbi:MAG: cob(I)yrinic acid a,c-diamide adenosyltransferase [Betaproteobacteria bacterium]|jgi:cob(I)alamin adenosyltransferase|nr:cob(I)yrinic acid a,c-diamide adenosyltransferase [Methylophilaceae bacterium]NCV28229.1 cob(I)yrinic acid a,c-diamide adenosyltransferase [Nitrosomonadales bacterium]NCV38501.1 cob(I)yrinic acid a,c-diamide adenosyltransferase [Betaproteobacteria bacterium]NCV53835.1 cob(I)yrinic acid a,c-diamide adenosyltransferase [Betaproteobacteria bacterium]NCW62706.1 cob(I)yrinic acid a,c-diamide adenosyltransferase [Betaproteobacteria bacterium]
MADRLTHIYTKTGDNGETSLGNGQRVKKNSIRVECLGSIDELNSIIGLILTEVIPERIKNALTEIQHDLFNIGGELSIPSHKLLDLKRVDFLEIELDEMNKKLPPLKEFILPGGSKSAAFAHVARTVCRRAERNCINLKEIEAINSSSLYYLNRLSDFLFVLARTLNQENNVPDTLWKRS